MSPPIPLMNPSVLKFSQEDRVKLLMLTKTKFPSLNKLNIFTYDNIDNHTKGLWLVNGYIIYFRRKLEDNKLQIVHLEWFSSISSQCFRLENEKKHVADENAMNNESTINFKTILRIFMQSCDVIICI